MSREHVDHKEIARFAQDHVNLPKKKAKTYSAQARNLQQHLEHYLSEHPDFTLRKLLLSGSLAKGTALRSLNDIDMACYISGADAPFKATELIEFLATRLQTAFPNFSLDQVQLQTYCVKVSFRGTRLNVDVVPILYDEDPDWYGYLVSQDEGTLLKTNIPYHLEFAKRRKEAQPHDFAQVVRLVKCWVNNLKEEDSTFRFKSFMVELILAHLSDRGVKFSDYPTALQYFFTYVVKSDLGERIAFADFYQTREVGYFAEPVRIIDPVNEKNNVARLYTDSHADAIVKAALDAGDAIDAALAAPTKKDTARFWRKVFGQAFHI